MEKIIINIPIHLEFVIHINILMFFNYYWNIDNYINNRI